MENPLVIIGTGGHSSSLTDLVESTNCFEIKGYIAENFNENSFFNGIPIIGSDNDFEKYYELGFSFLIGLGQIKSHINRKKIFDKLVFINAKIPNIISPLSIISSRVTIGIGNSIFHHVIINANVKIGNNCIINTKALIEHDSTIGSNTHISTGAIINGNVNIGQNCFVGSGSIISNGVNICDNVIIGAGSIILKNIDLPGTYVGQILN